MASSNNNGNCAFGAFIPIPIMLFERMSLLMKLVLRTYFCDNIHVIFRILLTNEPALIAVNIKLKFVLKIIIV